MSSAGYRRQVALFQHKAGNQVYVVELKPTRRQVAPVPTPPALPPPLTVTRKSYEPELVRIEAGSYRMGCVSGKGCESDEKPVHRVRVDAFELGKYEVTFDQWDACHNDGGCSHRPKDRGWGRGKRPVIYVSWDDAQEYVSWLSRKTGKAYRLPSESEWEYATRAGTTGPFSFSGKISSAKANYHGNYTFDGSSKDEYREKTLPVGRFPANAWGLHDVHGNVWEWTEDCWNDNYSGAPQDGSAWTSAGDCNSRVFRGGSWSDGPRYLRSANRSRFATDDRLSSIGFRVARALTP